MSRLSRSFHVSFTVCLLAISIAMGGCLMKVGTVVPNDHMAYPNANVESLGPVKSSIAKWTVLIPLTPSKEIFEELQAGSVKQKGGDLLINGKMTTQMVMLPFIYYTEITLEGTAAKQTIGRQELH